ncbi:hypothetical protein BV22DRAFT_1191857 [Leucogyrophana mollusca]|uniref:Uncharacterized protein n=1 Tax=Leucogyrophana mollusca TaxID=85980 RepID=A0ACB8BUJ0_9AGAM|nr:hypothetical protein BV22DRAFT_1191857 [Leucogyrophana mollusca]
MRMDWDGFLSLSNLSGALYPRMPLHPMQRMAWEIAECIIQRLRLSFLVPLKVSPVDLVWYKNGAWIIMLEVSRMEDPPSDGVYRGYLVVNLDTQQVHELGGEKNQVPIPVEITPLLNKFRDFILRNLQVADDVAITAKKQSNIQAYYERLLKCGLIEPGLIENQDSKLDTNICPVCSYRLISCSICSTVACENDDCQGSKIIPFERCSTHHELWCCHPCIDGMGYFAKLAQCPQCEYWYCSSELDWCAGRPLEMPDSTDASLYYSPFTTARVHLPKPTPCRTCTINGSPRGTECHILYCWSHISFRQDVVCSDCSPQNGVSCVCEGTWACDECANTASKSSLAVCPRCLKTYCYETCDYIDSCTECMRPRLCLDCIEEEGTSDAGADLSTRCEGCGEKYCEICEGKRPVPCGACDSNLCKGCLGSAECSRCDGPLCENCTEEECRCDEG